MEAVSGTEVSKVKRWSGLRRVEDLGLEIRFEGLGFWI